MAIRRRPTHPAGTIVPLGGTNEVRRNLRGRGSHRNTLNLARAWDLWPCAGCRRQFLGSVVVELSAEGRVKRVVTARGQWPTWHSGRCKAKATAHPLSPRRYVCQLEGCGRTYWRKRPSRYCSPAHRTAAYRARLDARIAAALADALEELRANRVKAAQELEALQPVALVDQELEGRRRLAARDPEYRTWAKARGLL